jgi:hypothetical protein
VFQCTSGGLAWEESATALEDVISWIWLLWLAYVGFVVFAFTNTVTGIFVDQAIKSSNEDARNVMLEQKQGAQTDHVRLRSLFQKSADDGAGKVISWKAMNRIVVEDPIMRSILKKYDCDVRDVLTFYQVIANGELKFDLASVDQLIRSIFRLKGPAKSVDLCALAYRMENPSKDNQRVAQSIMCNSNPSSPTSSPRRASNGSLRPRGPSSFSMDNSSVHAGNQITSEELGW